jgi:hypothetical protein
MKLPSSPNELLFLHLFSKLDSYPEGSTIQIPVKQLRQIMAAYQRSVQLILHLEGIIEKHNSNH